MKALRPFIVHLDQGMLDRLDAAAGRLALQNGGPRPAPLVVLRAALARGLDAMEVEAGIVRGATAHGREQENLPLVQANAKRSEAQAARQGERKPPSRNPIASAIARGATRSRR